MSRVLIVGGGAAGMIAAISAAYMGHQVSIYEKNSKLGKKLFITGKGRCNLTNASDMSIVMDNVVKNPKFLYSSFKEFDNKDIMDMIENEGCSLKVERGNRVFPMSDKSSDIIRALEKILSRLNVEIKLLSEVADLIVEDNICKGIVLKNKNKIYSDAVILATGGKTYPATGSSGDGYNIAKRYGHEITKLYNSLVPFNIAEESIKSMQGLSLKNISISIIDNGKKLYEDFGEILFTHFGISGPLILSASSYITELLSTKRLDLYIDLKPALSYEQLDLRIQRDFEEFKNKAFKNALVKLLPGRLIDEVIRFSKIDENKRVNEITSVQRALLVKVIKGLKYSIIGTRGVNEAIITRGGISVKEVDPKTMESKIISSLYFAGEILDLDALTGGYNLQIAWSTGYSAGRSIDYV